MWLLLDTNRKASTGSPTAPLDLTLGDLERSKSRPLRFQNRVCYTGAKIGHILLLNTYRKSYIYGVQWHL